MGRDFQCIVGQLFSMMILQISIWETISQESKPQSKKRGGKQQKSEEIAISDFHATLICQLSENHKIFFDVFIML